MKVIISALFLMLPFFVSGQTTNYKIVHKENGYKHYDDHKDQPHANPDENSYNPDSSSGSTPPDGKMPASGGNTLTAMSKVYKTRMISKDTLSKLKVVMVSGN